MPPGTTSWISSTDDLKKTELQHRTAREAGGLGTLLFQIVFEGRGEGHYKPVQDVLSAVVFHVFGPDGWGRAVMALYLVLHALTAYLLRGLMTRFGAVPEVALLGALIFLAHPVIDSALVAVQFAPNVIGFFFLVAALHVFSGGSGEGRPGVLRLYQAVEQLRRWTTRLDDSPSETALAAMPEVMAGSFDAAG